MSDVNEQAIIEVLRGIRGPDDAQDVVSRGLIQGLQVRNGHVAFTVEVDPERAARILAWCDEAFARHDLALSDFYPEAGAAT